MLKTNHIKLVGILSIILGVLFVMLFYKQKIGVSYTIYTIIIVAYYYFALSAKKEFKSRIYFGGIIYIVLLSTIYFRSDFILFRALNLIAIPILLCVNLILCLDVDIKLIVGNTLETIFIPIGRMHMLFIELFKNKNKNKGNNSENPRVFVKVLLGIAISIPALLLIISLLTSADIVFADKMSNILSEVENILEAHILMRILLTVIVASYLFGQIYYLYNDERKQSFSMSGENESDTDYKGFDRIITITFLIILDVVYLSFVVIQFIYLFGGNNNLPVGYTYAEYAREGFFQLVFLSMINIILIFMINKLYLGIRIDGDSSKGYSYKKDIVVDGLLSIMVICTFVLIISSIYKLGLYEEAYGYTRLRLLVFGFIVFEAAIMLLVTINIWNKKFPIIKIGIITLLVSYLIINFINIDGIVARENINRYVKTGKIDLQYLVDLSADAIGEISHLEEIDKKMYNEYIERLNMDELEDMGWQSFNLSIYNRKKIIE